MFIFTKISLVFDKIVIFKILFWSYFYQTNIVRVFKITCNWLIIWLIITSDDTAKCGDKTNFQLLNNDQCITSN